MASDKKPDWLAEGIEFNAKTMAALAAVGVATAATVNGKEISPWAQDVGLFASMCMIGLPAVYTLNAALAFARKIKRPPIKRETILVGLVVGAGMMLFRPK